MLYKPVAAKKATSKISLWNAKLHHKAEELRDGKGELRICDKCAHNADVML